MNLRKGYKIVNDRGKTGIITEFSFKNKERVIGFEGIDNSDGWCYRNQILEVYKQNGERIY
ncbi:MAG: hypothetical protein K0S61_690 [Anaerocolumna sp.]|nr:hypothetical protein [Anaerocolumna sp.]